MIDAGYEDAVIVENPALLKLKRALVNEQIAPEILNYENAAVSELRERVEQQEAAVNDVMDGDASDGDVFTTGLMQMELDRVRFLIRSYLRVRLAKIEKHAFHIMSSAVTSALLSAAERKFAEGFIELTATHLDGVLATMPERFRELKAADMVVEPALSAYVFCRAREDIEDFRLR